MYWFEMSVKEPGVSPVMVDVLAPSLSEATKKAARALDLEDEYEFVVEVLYIEEAMISSSPNKGSLFQEIF